MHWNYRVVKTVVNGEVGYAIHEAYYDDGSEPTSITEKPATIYAESLEGLRQELELMTKALDITIIEDPDL